MVDVDTSKLAAVNAMLARIGEAPFNTLDVAASPDVALAVAILDEVSRETQVRGWHWNTDENVVITPESDGRFPWQTNWIRFDTEPNQYGNIDLVRRGEYLWDRRNNTDEIPHASLRGIAVIFIDWDSLPEAARNYIMVRATRKFVVASVGDEQRAGYGVDDERRAWHVLEGEESQQSNANIHHKGMAPLIRRRFGTGLGPGRGLEYGV